MAPKMKPEDLKTKISKVKGYSGTVPDNVKIANMPRKLNGAPFNASSDVNKHFFLDTYPLSLKPTDEGVARQIHIGEKEGAERILYLEYYDKNITSTVIPTNDPSVCYFTTTSMSGCNFFIDELPNGNLVCHHANARQHSPALAEVEANPAAFHPAAVTTMDKQHRDALMLPAYQGARPLCALRKADYYAGAKRAVDAKRAEGYRSVDFNGGTTIMGFRVNGRWQFWFQTYGQITYTIPGGLFKKKQVITTKQEIIEYGRFWPKQ